MIEAHRLVNTLKAHMAAMLAQQPRARYGIVESFDPNTYTARVTIQPEGALSGWLPVLTQWVGNGWGMFCPPTPGDQVKLVPQEADGDSYAIIGRAFSTVDVPLPAPSGEFWLVHQTGSCIKLVSGGVITITGTSQVNVTAPQVIINAATEFTVNSPVIALNGDVTQTAGGGSGTVTMVGPLTVTNEVTGSGIHLSQHIHGGVESGGASTAAPTAGT